MRSRPQADAGVPALLACALAGVQAYTRMMQVLDLVAANGNDSMVDCTLPGAGGNWGMCVSMLFMLQDDTKATFVKSTFVSVVRASKWHHPS